MIAPKRKIVIAAALFFILLIISAISIAAYLAEIRLPKTRAQFLSYEDIIFYKKYNNQLNHLRSFDFLKRVYPGTPVTKIDYLFSTIGGNTTEVLIQGDSWAEQFMTNPPSFITLQNFAEHQGIGIAVGGTSSYSPSVMQAQYRILRDDFGFEPKVVVGVIDQTDIGDELCRYRDQLVVSAGGENIVKPYTGPIIVPFHLERYFRAVEILDAPNSALIKLLKYKIELLRPAQYGGCGHEILSPLISGINQTDQDYFVGSVSNYINEVFRPLETIHVPGKLILVTHFHKKHTTGEYKLTIADLVTAAIMQSKYREKITHINFLPGDYKDEDLNKIFIDGDAFSHLTDYFHRKVFTRRILDQIKISLPTGESREVQKK